MHPWVDGVWEFIGCTLVVVNHRSVFGPGSHRWIAGSPERIEARPTKLPEVHLLAMTKNLISLQSNLKQKNIFIQMVIPPGQILGQKGTKEEDI